MAERFFMPRATAFDGNGDPIPGGKLEFYIAGTSTPLATYSDAGLTVANANPVIADSAGRFGEIFLISGEEYKVILKDADNATIWTADPYVEIAVEAPDVSPVFYANRIVNGAMLISQQNTTSNVDTTTGAAYTLDQWEAVLSTTPGGTLRVAQNATVTPQGSPYRLRATAQVSDGTIAAANYYMLRQQIEGWRVSNALLGTSGAKALILRFGVRSSVSGTFGLSICNGAVNRSYATTYQIAAGEVSTDVVRTVVIPGDVAGTWTTAETAGLMVRWCLAAGTDFQGAANTWTGADIITTSAQTNFMGTGSATFDLFDVALYVDTAGSSVAPTYEFPRYEDELAACQRYWWKTGRAMLVQGFDSSGAWAQRAHVSFPVEMRVAPTSTNSTSFPTNVASAIIENIGTGGAQFSVTSSGAGGFYIIYDATVSFSARL